MLLALYLVLVIALPVALGALVARNGLPRTRSCPLCAGQTIRLRSRRHRLLSRPFPREEFHARWCPACDWSGTVRLARELAPAHAPVPAATTTARPSAGLQIRRVDLEDGAWRVQLECWAEENAWHGRLLFLGPGGLSRADDRALLTGRSALQVLSQVLTMSDEALVGLIRKANR